MAKELPCRAHARIPARVRILLDYRPALRQRTGVGQYVHEMASALQPQLSSHERLTLFSSSWADRLDPAVVPGAQTRDLRVPVRLLNLAWHRLEWPPVERLAGRADIAHSSHPLLMPSSEAAQVVTIYDLDFLDHPDRTRAEIRRDYPSLAAAHARRADLVVVISRHTAAAVAARFGIGGERVVICRPGAPDWAPRVQPAAPGPILFVGTIEGRKNLPALFAAYEEVVSRRPDAPPLVLAGRHVEGSAAILESVGRREMLRGRKASMLVLPSFEEGFGLPALEAMQMGVPVFASRRGALPEVVGEAGTLVDPGNTADLARAIESLLADPGLRLAHAAAGLERAREFSWRASAGRLLDAYRELLTKRRSLPA